VAAQLAAPQKGLSSVSKLYLKLIYRAGWPSGNCMNLYLVGDPVQVMGETPAVLSKAFRSSTQSLQANAGFYHN
jgi:hypothetical protein